MNTQTKEALDAAGCFVLLVVLVVIGVILK